MSTSYALTEGRYACTIGDTAIVMDTVMDKYFCFPGRQGHWFAEITAIGQHDPISRDAGRFAKRLCERGILVELGDVSACKDKKAPYLPMPPCSHVAGGTDAQVRLAHVLALSSGFLQLGYLQHPERRNLQRILVSVERWKLRARRNRRRPLTEITALADSFHALAPWFFSLHDACFFRSLLLIHFLMQHGVAADWTFAVRLSPFRAHCWVSFEGVLLNEHPDIVAGYHPILVV